MSSIIRYIYGVTSPFMAFDPGESCLNRIAAAFSNARRGRILWFTAILVAIIAFSDRQIGLDVSLTRAQMVKVALEGYSDQL